MKGQEKRPQLQAAFPATKRVKRSAGAGEIAEIDLDVTPMMNVMIVLIPFLVSMAVFTHIAIVEFSLPPGEAVGGDMEASKELDISIVVTRQGFRIVGTGKKLDLVPLKQGHY